MTPITVTTSLVDTCPRAPALASSSQMRSTSSPEESSRITIIISVLPSMSTLRAQGFSSASRQLHATPREPLLSAQLRNRGKKRVVLFDFPYGNPNPSRAIHGVSRSGENAPLEQGLRHLGPGDRQVGHVHQQEVRFARMVRHSQRREPLSQP